MTSEAATSHLGTHRRSRVACAAFLVLALVLTLAASPAEGASRTACRVKNIDSGKSHTTLQAAVDVATRGDRLTVRSTCRGRTIIDRSIVIVGVPEADPRRPPTLTGGNRAWVIVVRKALKVRIDGLRIQGTEDPCTYERQGVRNLGNLTLSDVEVRRLYGGIANEGRLRLIGAASVEDNCRSGVVNDGLMTMRDTSRVIRNAQGFPPTMFHGALAFHNTGTLTMDDSSRISHNGEVLYNNGSMTVNGTSVISHNPVSNNWQGVLTLNDSSSIRSNHLPAVECGGSGSAGLPCPWESCAGVENAGRLTLNDTSSIRDNSAAGNGGGVCNSGSLTLNDSSSISGNSAGGRGGGVQMNRYAASPPSLTMAGNSAIVGNSASEGGGLWYSTAYAALGSVSCGPGGNVYDNTPDDCYVEP